jgi:glycogen synthase
MKLGYFAMSTKNMNVLMIGWEYPPHNSGGLGVACQGLTEALAGQKTNVYFTLPYHHDSNLKHLQVIDCSDALGGTAVTQPPFSGYGQMRETENPKQDLINSQMERQVEIYAQEIKTKTQSLMKSIDVIHAHDWMSFPAAQQLKIATNKPVIAHIHSTEFDRIPHGTGSHFIHYTEAEGLAMADKIIAVSNYTKHVLIQKYNVPAKKISVIHNGLSGVSRVSSHKSRTFAPERPVIVFMGRLTMQKGAEYFLKLAEQVTQSMPEALFVVAGDGDMYHQLLFKSAEKHLSASVLFSGFLRDRQKEELLNRADVFIMPSISEPFGLVAVEAAQRRIPVIVSKQTGITEVLRSALQVDFWDVDKMTDLVIELCQNKSAHALQVKSQLKDISGLTWQKAAFKVRDLYHRAFVGR